MADLLKTDYKDDLLDTSANTERKFNLVDADGNVVAANVSIQDITAYSQVGDNFGAADINKTNGMVNSINGNLANGNASFSIGEDGKPYITYEFGGDTITKKLGSGIDGDTVPLIEKGVANEGVTIRAGSSYCVITYHDGYFTVANNNSTARGLVDLDVTDYDYLLLDCRCNSNSYIQVNSANRYGSRIDVSDLTGVQRVYLMAGAFFNIYGVKH